MQPTIGPRLRTRRHPLQFLSKAALRRLTALVISVSPVSAFAQAGYWASVYGSAADQVAECYANNTTSDAWSVACGVAARGHAASGSATATVGTGHLGVTATSIADARFNRETPSDVAAVTTQSSASFSDIFQINSGSHSGVGDLTFRLYLGRTATLAAHALAAEDEWSALGAASVAVLARAFIGGSISSQGQFDSLTVDYSYLSGTTTSTYSSGTVNGAQVESGLGYQTFTVPFVFNQATSLGLVLDGYAFAQGMGNAAGAATLTAMNSLDWGGIVGITFEGAPVLDYTVTSESGTDWTKNYAPVPEPATGALTLAGLAALAFATKRRGRRSV